jgi:hypothetical protein
MLRYVRLVLIVITVIALFVLGAVAALYLYITPERVQARLSEALYRDLGVTVEPSGPVKVRILPRLRIAYPKSTIRLTSTEAASGVDSALFEMTPFAFFASRPRIDSLTLVRPALTISTEDWTRFVTRDSTETLPIWNIGALYIQDGTLSIERCGGAEPVRFTGLKAGFAELTEKGAALTAAALASLPSLSGEMTLKGQADWSHGIRSLTLGSADFTFKGLAGGRDLRLEAKADSLTLGESPRAANASAAADLPEGRRLTASCASVSLVSGVLSTDALNAAFSFDGEGGRETLSIRAPFKVALESGELSAQPLEAHSSLMKTGAKNPEDLGRMTGEALWSGRGGTGRLVLEGSYRGMPLSVRLTGTGLAETASGEGKPELSGDVRLGRLPAPIWRSLLAGSRLLDAFNGSFRLEVSPELPGSAVTSFSAGITVKDGRASWKDGTSSFGGTSLISSGELSADGAWHAEGRWDRALPELLAPFASAVTSGSFKAEGRIGAERIASLSAKVSAADGELYGADLPSAAAIMADEQPENAPKRAFKASSATPFSSLSFVLSCRDGACGAEQGLVKGDGFTADFAGEAGALKGTVTFTDALGHKLFAMPAVVSAKDGKAVWTPDWNKALAEDKAKAGEKGWSVKRAKDWLLRRFDDWWQGIELPSFELPDWPDWLPWGGDKKEPAPGNRA